MTLYLVAAVAFLLGFLAGRWNSSAARPSSPAGPASPEMTPVPAVTPVTGNGPFQIFLADGGPNAIRTIKAIRAATRLGLKDAKDLHDRAPTPLIMVRTAAEADAVQREFLNIAHLEIVPLAAGAGLPPSTF